MSEGRVPGAVSGTRAFVLLCLIHRNGLRNGFLYLRFHSGSIPGAGLPLRAPVQKLYIGVSHVSAGELIVDPGHTAVCLFCVRQIVAERGFRLREVRGLRERHMILLVNAELQGIHQGNAVYGKMIADGGIGIVLLGNRGRAELIIAEVKKGLGVPVLGVVAVQDHGDERHAVPFAGRHQGVAGSHGVAGLSGEDTGIVLAVALPHHVMMGIDGVVAVSLRVLGDGTVGIDLGAVDLPEGGILDGILQDLRHVGAAGVVLRVIEARGIHKVGIRAADGGGLLIHELCKGGIGAGDILRQGIGAVVGGMQQERIEAVPDGQLVSGHGADDRGVGVQIGVGGRKGEGHHVIQLGDVLQHYNGGQHLGDGGRIVGVVLVLSVEHGAGIRVNEDGALGLDVGGEGGPVLCPGRKCLQEAEEKAEQKAEDPPEAEPLLFLIYHTVSFLGAASFCFCTRGKMTAAL